MPLLFGALDVLILSKEKLIRVHARGSEVRPRGSRCEPCLQVTAHGNTVDDYIAQDSEVGWPFPDAAASRKIAMCLSASRKIATYACAEKDSMGHGTRFAVGNRIHEEPAFCCGHLTRYEFAGTQKKRSRLCDTSFACLGSL
jgi:hypothetical protein